MMNDQQFSQFEKLLTEKFERFLEMALADRPFVDQTQVPSSVIKSAARAAAGTVLAFERGYRIGDS